MIMRTLFFLISILYSLNTIAGKGDIEVVSSPYDFGKVYNWDNPPALFEIVNRSNKTLDFLPTFPSQNFQIKLPQKSIAPGESARVEVIYYTKETGPFSEKVEIFTGNSAEPIVLKIKGEIMSMSPSAFTACPSINNDRETVQNFYQEVMIVDGKTRQPIENAEVKWFYNNRTKYKNTTDKRGRVVEEVVMGQYSLLATSDGYEPNTANGLISRGTGLIIIPLNPIIKTDYSSYEVDRSEKPRKDPAEGGIYYPVTRTKSEKPATSSSNVEAAKKETEEVKSASKEITEEESVRKNSYAASNDEDDSYDDYRSDNTINVLKTEVPEKEGYNNRADFSDVEYTEVDLSHYENDRESNRDRETESAYQEKIEALRKAEQEKQNSSTWSSPFDNYSPEDEEPSIASDESKTNQPVATDNAESPELEFYNRNSPPKEDNVEQAAYQAYLEELRKVETQLSESYKKPDFHSGVTTDEPTVSSSDDKETTARAATNPVEANINETKVEVVEESIIMDPSTYAANNVLFLLDVSTSMRGKDRIDLLKLAMSNLIDVMRDFDYLTIMTYSSETEVVLDRVKVENKDELKQVINNLEPEGWTFGLKGLNNAFEIVNNTYIANGNNQIIISTDGKFNNPTFTEKDLYSLVRSEGGNTKLSVIGFGEDDEALKRMKRLARVGNGNFMHITNQREAGDALIEEIKSQSLLE